MSQPDGNMHEVEQTRKLLVMMAQNVSRSLIGHFPVLPGAHVGITGLPDLNQVVNLTVIEVLNTRRLISTMGKVYFYMTAVMSLLSISGALVILVSYFLYKDLRTSGRTLLVYLSTADLMTAVGNLLGICWYMSKHVIYPKTSHVFCNLHAAITIFSNVSSFLWTVAIAVHLYLCIVRNKSRLSKRLTTTYHGICWGLPGAMTLTTLISGVIGHDKRTKHPSWCWIDPLQPNKLFWQYFTGKGWEIATYLATVILYGRLKCFLMSSAKHSFNTHARPRRSGPRARILEANRRLTFVPVVFILIRIWGTLRFLLENHLKSKDVERSTAWIAPLQGIGDSAQGFANCILFILTTEAFRSRLIMSCTARSTCLRHRKQYRSNQNGVEGNTPVCLSSPSRPSANGGLVNVIEISSSPI